MYICYFYVFHYFDDDLVKLFSSIVFVKKYKQFPKKSAY